MGSLVLEYYFVLRSVLKAKPSLRRCLKRCRHCRIFFLTDPRNAHRNDLGCPFGCKEAHRKRCSSQRSTAYYRTDSGREKKRVQNAKRSQGGAKAGACKETEKTSPDLELDGRRIEAGMVAYVRVVASLIEGRVVHRDEVVEMLRRAVRQHSISREKRIDYVLRYLKATPP